MQPKAMASRLPSLLTTAPAKNPTLEDVATIAVLETLLTFAESDPGPLISFSILNVPMSESVGIVLFAGTSTHPDIRDR